MLREGLDNMFVDHPRADLLNRVTLSVSELEYFEVSKLSKFHSMPRLDGCPYFKPKAVFEIA